MADKYKSYLAANVLTESRLVTYRSLSRALKVHSNIAKEMLYDFHRQETTKKPGSIHATYLLSGIRRPTEAVAVNGNNEKDGEDEYMQSSPFMSSSMPNQDEVEESIPIRCITLVREEDLEDLKAQYETIFSLHIYSLGPSSIKDLQILSDSNREIYAKYASEDPLQACIQYGTIQNPNVKRRTGRQPPSAAAAAAAMAALAKGSAKSSTKPPNPKEEKKASHESSKPGLEKQSQEQAVAKPATKIERRGSTDTKPAPKQASLKRDKSDIFKSFAKSKASLKREGTGSSAGVLPAPSAAESVSHPYPNGHTVKSNMMGQQPSTSAVEDEPMKDVSEDEDEEEDVDDTPKVPSKTQQAKLERQKQLEKMMEDDEEDEPMQDAPVAVSNAEQQPLAVDEPQSSAEIKHEEPPVVVSSGRRRGKRRVMKKKTIKDDEGYLVTREEPSWESFSEEEPKPLKSKTPVPTSSASGKAKKPLGKAGQGNLMSFFSKK